MTFDEFCELMDATTQDDFRHRRTLYENICGKETTKSPLVEANEKDPKGFKEIVEETVKCLIEREHMITPERPRVYGDEILPANLRQRDYPCGCHWIKHFGFIPHMDCKKHKYITQTYG